MSKFANKIISWELHVVWENGYEEILNDPPKYVENAVLEYLQYVESTEISEQ